MVCFLFSVWFVEMSFPLKGVQRSHLCILRDLSHLVPAQRVALAGCGCDLVVFVFGVCEGLEALCRAREERSAAHLG